MTSGTPLDSYDGHSRFQSSDSELARPHSHPSSSSSDDTSLSESAWDQLLPTLTPGFGDSTTDQTIPLSSSAPSSFQDFAAMGPQDLGAMFGTPIIDINVVGDGTKFSHPLHTEQLANGFGAPPMNSLWQQPHEQSGSQPAATYSQRFGAPQHGLGQHMQGAMEDPLADPAGPGSAGMFGLEPMGYGHPAAMQSIPVSSVPAAHYQAQAQFAQGMGSARAGGGNGTATGDFAFADDSLSVWTNAPMFFG